MLVGDQIKDWVAECEHGVALGVHTTVLPCACDGEAAAVPVLHHREHGREILEQVVLVVEAVAA
jgi:hypothetical protein